MCWKRSVSARRDSLAFAWMNVAGYAKLLLGAR